MLHNDLMMQYMHSQVTVGSALESRLPANNPLGNRPQEQPLNPLDPRGHTAADTWHQNPPRWHPSLQSVNSFHGTRDQSIQPFQQPPQARRSLHMVGSTQQGSTRGISSQQRFHEHTVPTTQPLYITQLVSQGIFVE